MEIRSRYSERLRVPIEEFDEGVTQQCFKDECDINNIVGQFEKTGNPGILSKFQGEYGNATGPDFHQAMNMVIAARDAFDRLPSRVRKRFNNDPAAFLDFVDEEGNRDELIELGLIEPLRAGEETEAVGDVDQVENEPEGTPESGE